MHAASVYICEIIFEYAVRLIEKGLAYVDDSTSEEIANMKGTLNTPGIDSPYKSRTISENLDLFYLIQFWPSLILHLNWKIFH